MTPGDKDATTIHRLLFSQPGIVAVTCSCGISVLLGTLLVNAPLTRLLAAELVAVDIKPLATAYRASKIVGAAVVSDTNERIGSIDDLLIKDPDQAIFAILSVGGFLGIGNHLVVVPFSSLTIDDESRKAVLPGATKGELTKLPEFRYLR
jgi:hypothetical protein